MDSVTEVVGHLYQAVLIHTPTLNLHVHLCDTVCRAGNDRCQPSTTNSSLRSAALLLRLGSSCSEEREEGRSVTHTSHDHYTAFFYLSIGTVGVFT